MRLGQPRWASLLPARFVTECATLGPLGRRLPAPGTWGSLAGLACFAIFLPRASAGLILAVTAVAGYLAVGFCGEAERILGKSDPGEVILDEFVVMPLCLLGWRSLAGSPAFWVAAVAAFALFRLFDITKPFGISRLQDLPGGWGVVADDVAAALAACATLHLGAWAWSVV